MHACALHPFDAGACELWEYAPHESSPIVHMACGPHWFASGSLFESPLSRDALVRSSRLSENAGSVERLRHEYVLITLSLLHTDSHDVMPCTSTNERTVEPQALMAFNRPPDRPHIAHGIRCFISAQVACGDGPHEGITGVCSVQQPRHDCLHELPPCVSHPLNSAESSRVLYFLTFRIRILSRDAGVGLP